MMNICKLGALIFMSLSAATASAQSSSWDAQFMDSKQGVLVATMSESGNILGRYCYFKDSVCYWVLANNLSCTPGSTYSVLVSSKGAEHVELVCSGKVGERYRYFIKPFDTMDHMVRNGDVLGIALAMDSGRFQVNRFDLSGAVKSMNQADSMFNAAQKTKDQVL